jgi:hypothetical protein
MLAEPVWGDVDAAFALTGLLILGLPDRLPEEHHM